MSRRHERTESSEQPLLPKANKSGYGSVVKPTVKAPAHFTEVRDVLDVIFEYLTDNNPEDILNFYAAIRKFAEVSNARRAMILFKAKTNATEKLLSFFHGLNYQENEIAIVRPGYNPTILDGELLRFLHQRKYNKIMGEIAGFIIMNPICQTTLSNKNIIEAFQSLCDRVASATPENNRRRTIYKHYALAIVGVGLICASLFCLLGTVIFFSNKSNNVILIASLLLSGLFFAPSGFLLTYTHRQSITDLRNNVVRGEYGVVLSRYALTEQQGTWCELFARSFQAQNTTRLAIGNGDTQQVVSQNDNEQPSGLRQE